MNRNALLAWLAALGYATAALWPHLSASALPFTGLRSLSVPTVGWPLAAAAVVVALFLTFRRLHSRERLLVTAGFSLCLFLGMALYVSPIAGLPIGFVAGNLIRDTGKGNPAR